MWPLRRVVAAAAAAAAAARPAATAAAGAVAGRGAVAAGTTAHRLGRLARPTSTWVVNYATVEGAALLEEARDVDAGAAPTAARSAGTKRRRRAAAAAVPPAAEIGPPAAASHDGATPPPPPPPPPPEQQRVSEPPPPPPPHEEHGTPLMKQYLQIKAAYPEHILLFRLGDFYEMFFDDAVRYGRRPGGAGKAFARR